MTAVEQEAAATTSKRRADRQISKDDDPDEEDQGEPTGEFRKATPETMAARRVVKAKRPTVSGTSETETSSNPFAAAASSLTSKGGFGSGFSGFATKATGGFGAAFSAPSTGFGSAAAAATSTGFGTTAAPSVFGGSATKSIFGNQKQGDTATATTDADDTNSISAVPVIKFGETTGEPAVPKIALQNEGDVTTGEEDEECIFELRVKTFLWGELAEKKQVAVAAKETMSVPPSSRPSLTTPTTAKEETKQDKDASTDTVAATAATTKDDEASDGKDSTKEKDEPADKKVVEPATDKTTTGELSAGQTTTCGSEATADASTKKGWRELGTGPLKILRNDKKKVRLVQRREAGDGGKGTKLLLNVPLYKESKIDRPNEKNLKLTTMGQNGISFHLIKSKHEHESIKLQEILNQEIETAETLVK